MSNRPAITVSRTSALFEESRWLRAFVPAIDWLTGFRKLDKLYREHKFANLDAAVFAERFMALMEIKPVNTSALLDSVPSRGPCPLVC